MAARQQKPSLSAIFVARTVYSLCMILYLFTHTHTHFMEDYVRHVGVVSESACPSVWKQLSLPDKQSYSHENTTPPVSAPLGHLGPAAILVPFKMSLNTSYLLGATFKNQYPPLNPNISQCIFMVVKTATTRHHIRHHMAVGKWYSCGTSLMSRGS